MTNTDLEHRIQRLVDESDTPIPAMKATVHGVDVSRHYVERLKHLEEHSNEWLLWFVCELESSRERIEELEIELMLTENELMPEWKRKAAEEAVNFKQRRGNFKK